jgi:hypothetical protein
VVSGNAFFGTNTPTGKNSYFKPTKIAPLDPSKPLSEAEQIERNNRIADKQAARILNAKKKDDKAREGRPKLS